MNPLPVTRIAHAHGNRRDTLIQALAADIDIIELDVWYRDGGLYVRHERRLRWLPLLYDETTGGHWPGGFAVRIGRYFVRPDISPYRLEDVLAATNGVKHLMIDVKGRHNREHATRFARALIREIERFEVAPWISVCGQTYAVLDALRDEQPPFPIRYSMERAAQWDEFLQRMRADPTVRAVSIQHALLDEGRLKQAQEGGVNIYCWTVDDPMIAQRLVDRGVHGIISNDLSMLDGLPRESAAPLNQVDGSGLEGG
jgi:glycerophosphoryl diester phosphodiesterase